MVNFKPDDRSRRLLLPPDLHDWVPEDDPARYVIEAVQRVPMDAFQVNWRGAGKARRHPRPLLARARELGLLRLGGVSIDGATRDANASQVLADAGFAGEGAVARVAALGIEPLVAIGRHRTGRLHDFRPLQPDAEPPPEPTAAWRVAMRDKLETEAARARHGKRKCTVEPVFGIVKNLLGFLRFHLGGIENVKNAWLLVARADNGKRLHQLMAA